MSEFTLSFNMDFIAAYNNPASSEYQALESDVVLAVSVIRHVKSECVMFVSRWTVWAAIPVVRSE